MSKRSLPVSGNVESGPYMMIRNKQPCGARIYTSTLTASTRSLRPEGVDDK